MTTTDSSPSSTIKPELWYRSPANEWLEALPVGNGRLGAMVFGRIGTERLQFNEGTVWAGAPHSYVNPLGKELLPQIRNAVFAEDWATAIELSERGMLGQPTVQAPYQTVGDLHFKFSGLDNAQIANYRRSLDLDSAVAVTVFTADGVEYRREVISSRPDEVLAYRLTADRPGAISFGLTFSSPQLVSVSVDGNRLSLNGVSGESEFGPGEVKFCAIAQVDPEGSIAKVSNGDSGTVNVSNADAVTVYVSIGTSYRNFRDIGADPIGTALRHLAALDGKSWKEIKAAHTADHQSLFRRLTIALGDSDQTDLPTDRRLLNANGEDDPGLAALYCQYGRYLMIAGSRAGGLPTTLQGLWNDSLTPAWGSKWTININTEMNYWLAGPGNLTECCAPLFGLIRQASVSGTETAAVQYGAGGWVAHHNLDAWAGTSVVDFIFHGMWPMGGAWLCKSIWDYYEYTGDRDFLAGNYDLLKGASQFFLDTLVSHPKEGWLVTNPSVSPENAHHPDVSICAGPTMDSSILRDLFSNTAAAAKLLGVDEPFQAALASARSQLAPLKIGAHGQLQEWLDDWDAIAPEQDHRHCSHLYALHPSSQITPASTPELAEAARVSLICRGDESTGWATAWRIAFWARLWDGDHAHKVLSHLLTPELTAPNMFDLHPPFQIDGNFGGAVAILEMIVQSHENADDGIPLIRLLPALPSAWRVGAVGGLLTCGGFVVSLAWSDGQATRCSVNSQYGGRAKMVYLDYEHDLELGAGESYQVNFPEGK